MLVRDFECTDGHTFERFVPHGTDILDCPLCGKIAKRIVSAPVFHLDGCSGHFPTASEKWVKRREEKIALERKAAE